MRLYGRAEKLRDSPAPLSLNPVTADSFVHHLSCHQSYGHAVTTATTTKFCIWPAHNFLESCFKKEFPSQVLAIGVLAVRCKAPC